MLIRTPPRAVLHDRCRTLARADRAGGPVSRVPAAHSPLRRSPPPAAQPAPSHVTCSVRLLPGAVTAVARFTVGPGPGGAESVYRNVDLGVRVRVRARQPRAAGRTAGDVRWVDASASGRGARGDGVRVPGGGVVVAGGSGGGRAGRDSVRQDGHFPLPPTNPLCPVFPFPFTVPFSFRVPAPSPSVPCGWGCLATPAHVRHNDPPCPPSPTSRRCLSPAP